MNSRIIFRFLVFNFLFFNQLPAKEQESSIPDPTNLHVGWWSQFQNEEKNKKNVDQLISELNTLKSQIDSEKHPLTLIQIDQVILSAEQLKKKRTRTVAYKPIHPLYLSTYTLSEWLEVIHQKRKLENEQHKLQKESATIQYKIDSQRNTLDYFQLEYPLKKEGSVEKLMSGLKIMNLRFKIEANDLEVKRLQKISNLMDDNLQKMEKEADIAYTRINFSSLKEEEIQAQLKAAEALLVVAYQKVLEASKDTGTLELNQINSLSADLNLAAIKAQILFEKITLLMFKMDHEKSKEEVENELFVLSNSVAAMNASVKRMKDQLDHIPVHESTQYNEIMPSFLAFKGKAEDSQLLISLLKEKVINKETTFYQYILLTLDQIGQGFNLLWTGLKVKLFRINDYPVTLWVLVRAFAIFVGTVIIGTFLRRYLKKVPRLSHKMGRDNVYILSRILYYSLIIIGLLAASFSVGIDMTNFVIIAGALGVGVGLGLQGVVNNFFSGLVVLFSKILKVDDIIETDDGTRGRVISIKMQNTHVRTFDGKDVILPNSDLVTKKVVNWTMVNPYIRLHIPFSVEYGADKELVEKIVIEVAERFKFTMNDDRICPKPKVWLVALGNSSLSMELVAWVNIKEFSSRGSMTAEYLWDIERELIKNGIDIPFPKTDIRILETPANFPKK